MDGRPVITAAFEAFEQIFTPPFRKVLAKSLIGTLLLLAFGVGALERLVIAGIHPGPNWVSTVIHIFAGFGLAAAAVFLVPAVSFAVASFFFDEMADHVEAAADIALPRGRPMPILAATWIGIKFTLISVLVYAFALALLFVLPGFNGVIFFAANAYLLGRGFFELAALRFVDVPTMRGLRARHSGRIVLAGSCVAALSMVPIANLLTPLFATALLVRVAQRVVAGRPTLPYSAAL